MRPLLPRLLPPSAVFLEPAELQAQIAARRQIVVSAGRIDAGTVWINEHLIIFCETPWGGCKESGWGKDLSTMVLEEYTATKHVYVDLTGAACKPWYEILK